MCTRVVGTLAHVIEAAGLATVALSLVRPQIEQSRPPRALHCEFPLGRPLGRPGDPEFQRRVLSAAFALLQRRDGPVLEDFPEAIADHLPAARAAESWLYRTTETGAVLKAAMTQMAQADPPYERIFYLVPMSQQ